MFGSVNAIFSGLALAGIIFTILLQRKELILQRNELRETRKEFKTQNFTLKLQRFENTFFNLLSLHHQIVDAIDLEISREKRTSARTLGQTIASPTQYESITLKGRDVFKKKYEELRQCIEKNIESDFNSIYLELYKEAQTDFGHYFRNLYRIIKLVKETEFHSYPELELNPDNHYDNESYHVENYITRYRYTSMIRAQLSDYELLWIFYNCLSENGEEKFKPLVEEFTLLKNLPWEMLHDPDWRDEYNSKAFDN